MSRINIPPVSTFLLAATKMMEREHIRKFLPDARACLRIAPPKPHGPQFQSVNRGVRNLPFPRIHRHRQGWTARSFAKGIPTLNKTALIVALCLSSSAATAGMAEGVVAYEQRNYALAFKEFRAAAWEGNQVTQFYLGLMYSTGQGVAKDEKEAAVWYEKSARQGYAGAQVNLGTLYYKGTGVPQNYEKAAFWYRAAARQGLAQAQYSLGLAYAMGRGVDLDWKEAVNWYRKAADQGYAPAQHNLGVLYQEGKGVSPDRKEAAAWFEKAAQQGYLPSQFNIGTLYYAGDGVAADSVQAYKWISLAARAGDEASKSYRMFLESRMTPEQIEKAKSLAAEWKK